MRKRRSLFAVLLLATLFLAAAPAAADLNRWSLRGPTGGDVFALAVDPQNPSTVYAGSSATLLTGDGSCNGVFRSLDGGDTWARRGLRDRCVNALVVDPRNPAHLFAGTSRGIFRSEDGGETWSRRGDERCEVLSLAMDPQSSDVLYAGTITYSELHCGAFRSTDGGDTWTRINAGLPDPLPAVGALAVDPRDADRVYAAIASHPTVEQGVYRSLDGGDTWTHLAAGPSSASALVIDPGDPDTVWAGDYRSTDGGDTWEDVTSGLDTSFVDLAFDPDAGMLYAADRRRVFRSDDGGTTWTAGAEPLYTTILSLANLPGTSTVLAGTLDTGVFRSADGGDAWAPSSRGPVSRAVLALARDPSPPVANTTGGFVPSPIFAATDRGVYLSTDGGRSWKPRNRGLGGRYRIVVLGPRILETITDLVIDPQDPATLYLSTHTESGAYRSTDGGESWTLIGFRFMDVFALAVDPETPSNVLAGTGSGLFRSTDRGETWDLVLPFSGISSLAFAPSAPSWVYASSGDAILVSTDGGMSWAELEGPEPGVAALAVDPRDPFTLWAGTEAGVHRSDDGGVSWNAGHLGLAAPIRSLTIDPGRAGSRPHLYAGTAPASPGGVFRSIDGGASWWPVAGGLPRTSVRALAFDPWLSVLFAGAGDGARHRPDDGVFRLETAPVLELQAGRFRAEVEWREYRDIQGLGTVASVPVGGPGEEMPLRSRDSAVLEFFGPDNWEMVIKVLDGRALNDHFWLFFAAATNVGYTLTVTDTACDQRQSYLNIIGRPAPAVTDVEAFAGCASPGPPTCVAGADTFCLGEDDRFQVELDWHDFVGNSGTARLVTLPEGGLAASDDSGLFHFFGNDNWEVLVKVLDGCRFNDRFWVFSAATTDVEYRLTITDTFTGEARTYSNPLGLDSRAVTDVAAFDTCDSTPVPP